jgi:hypothetical protein
VPLALLLRSVVGQPDLRVTVFRCDSSDKSRGQLEVTDDGCAADLFDYLHFHSIITDRGEQKRDTPIGTRVCRDAVSLATLHSASSLPHREELFVVRRKSSVDHFPKRVLFLKTVRHRRLVPGPRTAKCSDDPIHGVVVCPKEHVERFNGGAGEARRFAVSLGRRICLELPHPIHGGLNVSSKGSYLALYVSRDAAANPLGKLCVGV